MNTKSFSAVALAGGLVVTLSACGSSSSTTNADANANVQGTYGGGSSAGNRMPGTSGQIAAISGSTAQVQSSSAQTAVTWNSSTTFTNEVATTKAAIKVGDCVSASRGSNSTSTSSTTVDAANVRIVSTSGGCTSAFQGRGGAPNGTRPSGMPTNMPTNMPSGGSGGRGFGGFGTIGQVTSITSTGFVVKPTTFGGSTSTNSVAVTTSSTTKYTETQKASASAIKVGLCMSANGTTDSTGAVTARRITLSQPTDGTCTSGFGSGFRGGAPGQGGPQNG